MKFFCAKEVPKFFIIFDFQIRNPLYLSRVENKTPLRSGVHITQGVDQRSIGVDGSGGGDRVRNMQSPARD